jgi:hypothetical protein
MDTLAALDAAGIAHAGAGANAAHAWRPAGPAHSFPDCLIIVYLCTRTHVPHPPLWPNAGSLISWHLSRFIRAPTSMPLQHLSS